MSPFRAAPGGSLVRTRALPFAVVALLAALFAMASLLPAGQRSDAATPAAHTADMHAMADTSAALNRQQLRFHDQMRKLWEDHVTWTRLAIVTFAAGTDGFDSTAGRLLQNQT